MFTKREYIEETAPAWMECEHKNKGPRSCLNCPDKHSHVDNGPNGRGKDFYYYHCEHGCGTVILGWEEREGGNREKCPYKDWCPNCHDEGGRWDPLIDELGMHKMNHPDAVAEGCPLCVTKSSYLIRRHEVCTVCGGRKVIEILGVKIIESIVEGYHTVEKPCPHCLKDSDGKPTGAEPGTATEWGVK